MRDHLEDDLSQFLQQQNASALVVLCLTVDENGDPHRQMAVYAHQASLVQRVSHGMLTSWHVLFVDVCQMRAFFILSFKIG